VLLLHQLQIIQPSVWENTSIPTGDRYIARLPATQTKIPLNKQAQHVNNQTDEKRMSWPSL